MNRLRAVLLGVAAMMASAALPAAAPAPAANQPLRLYVLNCGFIRAADVAPYDLKPDEVKTSDMAVPCYLIRHGRTWMFYDTGLGDAYNGKLTDIAGIMKVEVPVKLAPQLARLGLKTSDIGLVAISHFHLDHVGNLGAFRGATLLIQRAEADMVKAKPFPFTPPEAIARVSQPNVKLLDGDYDVFGDGSVKLLSTSGHTSGHQSLLVRLRRTGPVFLTGDLLHYPAERSLHRVPKFDMDRHATEASRERMEAIVRQEHAQLWILHDLDHYNRQRKAPQFYD